MIGIGFLAIVSYRWTVRELSREKPNARDPSRRYRDRSSFRRLSGWRANARKSHDDR
jgi:hypothetical protein